MHAPTRCPWEQAARPGNVFLVGLGILLAAGCARSTGPLDLTTQAPEQDQWTIATTYSREAEGFRQKAQELSDRVEVYERLFGPDSEWVRGTRLLAEYYTEAARERDRQADVHLGLVGRRARSNMEETPRTR